MANRSPTTKDTKAKSTGAPRDRRGPYDPKPGAAVKGKGRTEPAAAATVAEPPVRRAERRRELIKQRRHELRKLPQKRQRERLYVRLGLGAVGVLLLAGIAVGVFTFLQDRDLNRRPEGVLTFNYQAAQHDNGDIAYAEVPPVGGPHNDIWQNCGFYDQPIRSEHAVHSLEHGAVWITYHPDLPSDQVDKLRKVAEDQSFVLVSPFPDLPSPVVASSWNHQLHLSSADDKDLQRFIRFFKQNPQYTPEPGATCSNGTSLTVG